MKCLVLLAGCGLGDGSCIEEVILTYAALDKYGCDYTPVAEELSVPSVNHLTEQLAEKRNILLEAARIGRGRIEDIREIDFEEYGALIIPGGIGLLNNYRHSDAITACVTYFSAKRSPSLPCARELIFCGAFGKVACWHLKRKNYLRKNSVLMLTIISITLPPLGKPAAVIRRYQVLIP